LLFLVHDDRVPARIFVFRRHVDDVTTVERSPGSQLVGRSI